MIADLLSNKKVNPVVTELFIRGRKLNIFPVFITQFYFVASKHIRPNSRYYFIMKTPNKGELQPVAFNRNKSSDIRFKGFMNLHKKRLQNLFFFSYLYYSCIR